MADVMQSFTTTVAPEKSTNDTQLASSATTGDDAVPRTAENAESSAAGVAAPKKDTAVVEKVDPVAAAIDRLAQVKPAAEEESSAAAINNKLADDEKKPADEAATSDVAAAADKDESKDEAKDIAATADGETTAQTDAAAAGTKRKAEDEAGDEKEAAAGKPNGDGVLPLTEEPPVEAANDASAPNKKAKTEAVATAEESTPNTNGSAAKKTNGRAKKEKKPLPPVGKTARKTRSQGPVA